MKTFRKVGLLLLIIFIVMQFIQPKKNQAEGISSNDISNAVTLPKDVHQLLIKKCYDCHSNNTTYPWYFHVQPVGWWLAAHVHEGKEHLDFSEFKSYKPERVNHKLEEIGEVIEDGSMPLKAYTVIHKGAAVTESEAKAIQTWLASLGVESHH